MNFIFQSSSWYRCAIYRRQFFFFKKLIAEAEMNLEDMIFVYKLDDSITLPPNIYMRLRDFMLQQRES